MNPRDYISSAISGVAIIVAIETPNLSVRIAAIVCSCGVFVLDIFWPWTWLGKKKAIVIKSNKTD